MFDYCIDKEIFPSGVGNELFTEVTNPLVLTLTFMFPKPVNLDII